MQIETQDYRSHPALSQSDLSQYVQYDKFGIRSTNLITYKYRRPRKEGTDAMLVGTIVDGHFTEENKVDFSGDMDMLLINGEPAYEIPDRRSSKSAMPQISKSMANEIKEMIEAIEQIPEFNTLITESETQLILHDETKNLKGKIDLFHSPSGTLIDLKTSGTSIASFEKDFIFKGTISLHHRYVRQLAFYRLLARADGRTVSQCQILFVGMNTMENAEVKLYTIPDSTLDLAEKLLIADIEDLQEALKTNTLATTYPPISNDLENDSNSKPISEQIADF